MAGTVPQASRCTASCHALLPVRGIHDGDQRISPKGRAGQQIARVCRLAAEHDDDPAAATSRSAAIERSNHDVPSGSTRSAFGPPARRPAPAASNTPQMWPAMSGVGVTPRDSPPILIMIIGPTSSRPAGANIVSCSRPLVDTWARDPRARESKLAPVSSRQECVRGQRKVPRPGRPSRGVRSRLPPTMPISPNPRAPSTPEGASGSSSQIASMSSMSAQVGMW